VSISAIPKIFGCQAKFVILSVSTGGLFCVSKTIYSHGKLFIRKPTYTFETTQVVKLQIFTMPHF